MLLSMRAGVVGGILAERSHLAADTNLRLWETSAGATPLFPVVINNEWCNSNVSCRRRGPPAFRLPGVA